MVASPSCFSAAGKAIGSVFIAGTIAKERAASGTGNGTVDDDAAEELAAPPLSTTSSQGAKGLDQRQVLELIGGLLPRLFRQMNGLRRWYHGRFEFERRRQWLEAFLELPPKLLYTAVLVHHILQ